MTASPQAEQGRRVEPAPSTKPQGSARRGFGETFRLDRWIIKPALIAGGLLLFIVYATWSSIFGIPYFGFDYAAQGYHSPFFGINLGGALNLPAWFSAAILVLWIQVLFRATCYYFRGAYYKAFFLDPPSCAVGEPSIHRRFGMENKFPFILMNAHRFALYLAFIPLLVLWWDLVVSMTHDGHFRLGLGVFLIAADAILVTLYVGSCHSFRHLVGGSMDCFSCTAYTETRHGIWKWVSRINVHHGTYAWLSLFSIILVDLYVRALALDIISEATPIIGGFLVVAGIESRPHDVLIIGAGGAGLRAAVACIEAGLSVGVVCKSLLGKAHTVMAEGGMAASLAHVDDRDGWTTHFRDTMVGGYRLNNPRMAELHAKEAPDRVRELEQWGAVFDRTRDGRILQRPFGGHTYPRLAHVGDRTGLELIRTLQDRSVAVGAQVYQEVIITRLSMKDGQVNGAIGYSRIDGSPMAFPAKAVVLASGGVGRAFAVTSNSWESSGDGQGLAYRSGAELIDMEFVQFHPTGMVHPAGVKGLLVTEAVRGEGGILRNSEGVRFMWDYLPEARRDEYAATDEEARAWVDDLTEGRQSSHRRPPELSTRDNVARAIYTEVKEGRGSPHGGVFLDISYLPAERVRAKLPSMYEQFKELADVDITAGPMEVGPTMHYIMGGIKVDAEIGQTTTPGLYAAGEVAAGLHGSNRLGGNSLTDLLVFGRRAGEAASEAAASAPAVEELDQAFVDESVEDMFAPFERETGEDPNRLHEELQATMSSLVGIFRLESDLTQAIERIEGYKQRWNGLRATGPRRFNPGWDLVFELRNMLVVSEAIARSALERQESRGAHSRLDFVGQQDGWDQVNVHTHRDGDGMVVEQRPVVELPDELAQHFEKQA